MLSVQTAQSAGYDGQEKERKVDDERFQPNCNAPDDVPPFSKILQQLAGQAMRTRSGPQYGHVPGRQAHDVVFILRRMVVVADTNCRDGLRLRSSF